MKNRVLTSGKLFLFSALAMLLSFTAQSQTSKVPKFKLTQFDFGISAGSDRFNHMSYDQLMQFAESPENLERDLSGLSPEVSKSAAGLALQMNLGFSPTTSLTKGKSEQHLNVGVTIQSPRESMVSFKNELMDTSIVYCNLHSEFGMNVSYTWSWTFGKRDRLVWYIGGGVNSGLSFGNEMMVILGQYFEPGAHPSTQPNFEENRTIYTARPVLYNRVYIPYGLHYKVSDKMTIGFDTRRGMGVQKIVNGSSNWIRRSHSIAIGARIQL